jgi:hypothetical protein
MAVDIRDRRLEQALVDSRTIQNHGRWAIIIATDHQVSVEYGVIHSNGQHERAIGRLDYTVDKDGVVWTTKAHLCG